MKRELLSEAVGLISDRYLEEAMEYTGKKRPSVWGKWAAVAACLVLLVAGVLAAQTLGSGGRPETVSLSGGETLTFWETVVPAGTVDLDADLRPLTQEEITHVFGPLPVTGCAYVAPGEDRLLGFGGTYGSMKLVVSLPGENLLDLVVEGEEVVSTIKDTPVTAGYVEPAGGDMVLYYVFAQLDTCTLYLENAGREDTRQETREELVTALEALLDAPLDWTALGDL